jgi:hypothetical protein
MQIDRPSDMWTKVNIKGYVFPPNGSDVITQFHAAHIQTVWLRSDGSNLT